MQQRSFAILFFFYPLGLRIAAGNEREVVNSIFRDYDSRLRPVRNSSTTTLVHIFPVYLTLLSMNTAEETILFNMDYKQTWQDEFLQWNPADFNGVGYIRVPEEMIWTPDTYLDSSLEINLLLPMEKRKVQVFFNGNITIFNPQIIKHHCVMRVENFPYDSQKCKIQFTTWSYSSDQLILIVDPPVIGDTYNNIVGNSEWEMVYFKSSSKVDESNVGSFTLLAFTIKLQRNAVYYICVLIIPSFIIVTLCLLGIFAPTSNTGERHEKVTLGLTSLLTMAVILNIVADQMPKATKLPILGYFVIAEIFISTLAILTSIIIMFLHQRALAKYWIPPDWLMKAFRCKAKGVIRSNTRENIFCDGNTIVCDQQMTAKSIEVIGAFKRVIDWIDEKKHEKMLMNSWDDIFDSVDLVFLVFFQIANIVVSACLIL